MLYGVSYDAFVLPNLSVNRFVNLSDYTRPIGENVFFSNFVSDIFWCNFHTRVSRLLSRAVKVIAFSMQCPYISLFLCFAADDECVYLWSVSEVLM